MHVLQSGVQYPKMAFSGSILANFEMLKHDNNRCADFAYVPVMSLGVASRNVFKELKRVKDVWEISDTGRVKRRDKELLEHLLENSSKYCVLIDNHNSRLLTDYKYIKIRSGQVQQ